MYNNHFFNTNSLTHIYLKDHVHLYVKLKSSESISNVTDIFKVSYSKFIMISH